MNLTRRDLFSVGGSVPSAAFLAHASRRVPLPQEPGEERSFVLRPVGHVERDEDGTRLRILDRFGDALLGLAEWSHVNVFYWFDKNDEPRKRSILQVHPRGDRENPRTGVFACRAPVRPNLIALSVCKIVKVEKNVVVVDAIDAFHGTPILDLKPVIPPDLQADAIRVPEWAKRSR